MQCERFMLWLLLETQTNKQLSAEQTSSGSDVVKRVPGAEQEPQSKYPRLLSRTEPL